MNTIDRHFDVDSWLRLHFISRQEALAILSCSDFVKQIYAPDPEIEHVRSLEIQEYRSMVVEAFSWKFGSRSYVIEELLESVQVQEFDANSGPDSSFFSEASGGVIGLRRNCGSLELMHLAHEMSHALQFLLNRKQFVPPIAREVVGFIGELIVLDYAKNSSDWPYHAYERAHAKEDCSYLGSDLRKLKIALEIGNSTYHYRLNYPLARIVSSFLYEHYDSTELWSVIEGKTCFSDILEFVLSKARKLSKISNLLPKVRPDENENAVTAFFRSIGITVLLSVEAKKRKCDRADKLESIGEYFNLLSKSFETGSAVVFLSEMDQPEGFAVWRSSSATGGVNRLCAPFDNSEVIQKRLNDHLIKLALGS